MPSDEPHADHHHRPDEQRTWRNLWGRSRTHSHDHGNYDLEATDDGIHALKVSLVGLGLTAGAQVVVVALSGSVALLADTIHNFSDALTAVPLWFAFNLSRRRPSSRYTYGYGRAEDLAGLFIVLVVALSAAVAGWQAVERFVNPVEIRNLGWVAVAGLLGAFGNEAVAWYRIRVGRRIGSAALVADGMHARSDALTSLAVVLGAGGVALGAAWADPLVGLLVALTILFILRTTAREIIGRLMDAVDPEVLAQAEAVLAEIDGVEVVDSLRLRWTGRVLRADVAICCDSALTVVEAHELAVEVHHRLLHHVSRLGDAIVHVSPSGPEGAGHHERVSHHRASKS